MSDPNPNQDLHQDIEQRLAKLRAETTTLFTPNEIAERLARLTNRDPAYYSSTDPPIKIYQMISKQQRMTDTEKTDTLMEQLLSEISLDDAYGKDGAAIDAEIERRLALLRGGVQQQEAGNRPAVNLNARPKNHRELIAEILEQPDGPMSVSDGEEAERSDDDDALEWCNTCNEDATVQCPDCDGDIYCQECFRELHTDSDMRRHRAVPYQKKQKSSSSCKDKGKKT